MIRGAAALALLALLQEAPGDVERRARIEAAVNAWFEKGEPVAVDGAIEVYLVAIRRGAPVAGAMEPGLHSRTTSSGVPYLLRVPKGAGAKPCRLLVTLHGSNGSARAALASWGKSLDGEEDLLVAAPEAGGPGWGNARAGHDRIFSVIRDVSAAVRVDPDAVFLDGASMGAHGSFFLAMHYPDRFAGIAPRVGSARFYNLKTTGGLTEVSPAPPMLDNLKRLPVFLVAGVKDSNSPIDEVRVTAQRLKFLGGPFTYREHPDGGHEWFAQEDADVAAFFRAHRRDPYPARVSFTTREPAFRRCFWVEILDAARAANRETTHLDLKGEPLETRREYDKAVTVDAEADRKSNRILVRASGVKRLALWLHDAYVDLDRQVEVVVGVRTVFKGKVERSLKTALEDCKARGDRGMPYPARVAFDVP